MGDNPVHAGEKLHPERRLVPFDEGSDLEKTSLGRILFHQEGFRFRCGITDKFQRSIRLVLPIAESENEMPFHVVRVRPPDSILIGRAAGPGSRETGEHAYKPTAVR